MSSRAVVMSALRLLNLAGVPARGQGRRTEHRHLGPLPDVCDQQVQVSSGQTVDSTRVRIRVQYLSC